MKITDLAILCKWKPSKIGSVLNTYLPHCIEFLKIHLAYPAHEAHTR